VTTGDGLRLLSTYNALSWLIIYLDVRAQDVRANPAPSRTSFPMDSTIGGAGGQMLIARAAEQSIPRPSAPGSARASVTKTKHMKTGSCWAS
jgi:hypothetical protein